MTGTTRPGEAAAVEAGKYAVSEWETFIAADGIRSIRMREPRTPEEIAADVVAAAYPVIAAAVREQAAQDIEALDEPDWDTLGAEEMGWAWAQDAAARIVRGGR